MKKIILPVLVLGALLFASRILITMRPEPQPKEVVKQIPFVEVIEARQVNLRSSINTFGTVRPQTLTTLIAEVPGVIEDIAPIINEKASAQSFHSGGFFNKGELLLKIEGTNLKAALAEANANVSRTHLQLVQELELAKQAKIEWGARDWSLASDLVKRKPQIQKAQAEAKAAEAKLNKATRDLARALVKTPFQGRILKTMVDVGQQVGAGSPSALAEIYALDAAEVFLSLSQTEMNFLGFSDGFQNDKGFSVQVEVLNKKGKTIHQGRLERSEGVVDSQTRLTKLVALVKNCFANPFTPQKILEPLSVGQFVKVRLRGASQDVFVIPDSAFRTQNTILTVDQDNRLHIKEVETLHRAGKKVWVSEGLSDGEKVCITPIEIIANGMEVRVVEPVIDINQTAQ
jgi:RND family efflux transporter MFP subunit